MSQFAVYSSIPGKPLRWLSAISENEAKLRDLVTKAWRATHSVIFFGDYPYPFLVLESERIFLPYSEVMLRQRADKILASTLASDESILYKVEQEWITKDFDRDEMGLLPHMHLNKETLVSLVETGATNFTRGATHG